MNPKFTIENPMPPVWMMYPQLSQFSIGWRMGYGEHYKFDLANWLKTLTAKERRKYAEMFSKPTFWHGDFGNYYNLIPFWQVNGEMKYSVNKLNDRSEQQYLFFRNPTPNVDVDIADKSCLSQWQPSKFKVDADDYVFAEQYMMAEKARFFEDEKIEEQILQASDPTKIKAFGENVTNFDQAEWEKVKYSVVLNGNYYKFSQNKEMRDFLLSTADKILVQASPSDTIWGVELNEDDSEVHGLTPWKGRNLLGFALMEVRDELQKIYRNYDKIDWKQFEK
jgi:ribA/ribD-fused uncharacterized protein